MHSTRNDQLISAIGTAALFLVGFGLFALTRRSEIVPMIPLMIVIAPIFILWFSRELGRLIPINTTVPIICISCYDLEAT